MKFILIAALTMYAGIATAATTWVKSSDSTNDVAVYTKDEAGKRWVRAEATVNSPMKKTVAFVLAREAYPTWWQDLVSVETVAKNNPDQTIAYWHNKSPWPVMDRDVVTQAQVTQDSDTLEVTYLAKAIDGVSFVPLHSRRVRMTDMVSYIKVRPVGARQSLVTLEVSGSPGGAVPQFIADAVIVKNPKNSLIALKQLLESDHAVDPKEGSFGALHLSKLRMPGPAATP